MVELCPSILLVSGARFPPLREWGVLPDMLWIQPCSLLAGGRAEGRVPAGSQRIPRRPQKDAEPHLRGRAHPTAP